MLHSVPHGGTLINRILRGKDREMAEIKAKELKQIKLNKRDVIDILNTIAEKTFIEKLTNSEKIVLVQMLKKDEITLTFLKK